MPRLSLAEGRLLSETPWLKTEYGLQEILCTGPFTEIQNGMNRMQSMGQVTQ